MGLCGERKEEGGRICQAKYAGGGWGLVTPGLGFPALIDASCPGCLSSSGNLYPAPRRQAPPSPPSTALGNARPCDLDSTSLYGMCSFSRAAVGLPIGNGSALTTLDGQVELESSGKASSVQRPFFLLFFGRVICVEQIPVCLCQSVERGTVCAHLPRRRCSCLVVSAARNGGIGNHNAPAPSILLCTHPLGTHDGINHGASCEGWATFRMDQHDNGAWTHCGDWLHGGAREDHVNRRIAMRSKVDKAILFHRPTRHSNNVQWVGIATTAQLLSCRKLNVTRSQK